ncbi:MAG: DUF484 family protein [Pseudomonadales bacterium]|nr:DUF484 family protein [Pseudomonadales bacterium]
MTDEAIIPDAEIKEETPTRTKLKAEDSDSIEISEEQVAQYLKNNPNFFLNWENVLLNLQLPHSTGNAVSLVERQVSILRDRNIDLRNRFAKLIEAATDNDQLFNHTKKLVLELVEAGSLITVIERLQHSFEDDFKVDKASLLLFDGTTQDISCHSKTSNFAKIVNVDDAHQALSGILNGQQSVCGPLREKEATYLFGEYTSDGNNSVGSAAVIPLHFKGNMGILAIGSYDKNHFKSNMGTLFISYVSEVLSRLIRPYITFPATTTTPPA